MLAPFFKSSKQVGPSDEANLFTTTLARALLGRDSIVLSRCNNGKKSEDSCRVATAYRHQGPQLQRLYSKMALRMAADTD